MADAGFKLAVEGEREFKKAIAEINAQIKANAAELKLLTAQYGAADTGMEKLTANQKALEEGLALQGQKVATLREQYEKASATYGETDTRVVKLKTELANASTEYAKMSAEVEKNQAAIDAGWKAMEDYREATEKASEVVGGLDDIMAQNRKEIENLTEQYRKLGDGSRDAAAKQENLTAQNKLLSDSAESQRKKLDALNEELDAAVRLYGENSEEVKEYRDRVNEATRELNSLEDQIKDNDKALEDSEDAGDGLLGTLEKISEVTGIEIPEGIKSMIGSESGGGFLGAAVAAGGIGTALAGALKEAVELYKDTMDWADELTRKAQETDLGTEEYQELEYAALRSGVSLETLEDGMKELTNKVAESHNILGDYVGGMDDLKNATDEEKKAVAEQMAFWDELGVQIYDTSTGKLKPTKDLFYELIETFNGMTDSGEKAYKMNKIFGEEWNKLNPLVETGIENLKKWEEEARNTGIVMDEELVTKADAAAVAWETFGYRAGAALRNLVAEYFTRDWWKNWVPGINQIYNFKDVTGFLGTLLGIPAHANGTYNHVGGYALVGEKGPEIVELPRGSRVYPNGTGPQTGTVNNYSITISAKDVREFNDIVRIAEGQRQSIRMGYGRR